MSSSQFDNDSNSSKSLSQDEDNTLTSSTNGLSRSSEGAFPLPQASWMERINSNCDLSWMDKEQSLLLLALVVVSILSEASSESQHVRASSSSMTSVMIPFSLLGVPWEANGGN